MYGSGFCLANGSRAQSFGCLCHKAVNPRFLGCASAPGYSLVAMYAPAYVPHLLAGLLEELDKAGFKVFPLFPTSHHPLVTVPLPWAVGQQGKERETNNQWVGCLLCRLFYTIFWLCHFSFDCVPVTVAIKVRRVITFMLSLNEAFGASENFLALLASQKHCGTQQSPGNRHQVISKPILPLILVIHHNN